MTISEIIAALALVDNAVRTVFDIAWKIYMECKHAKKIDRPRLPICAVNLLTCR